MWRIEFANVLNYHLNCVYYWMPSNSAILYCRHDYHCFTTVVMLALRVLANSWINHIILYWNPCPITVSLLFIYMYHYITVLSFHCHKCDQLWDEIKSHGYTIKRIPTKAGNIVRTSLDQGIPLVMCSCSECKIPREIAQVLNSPIPDSLNVLQLHQADSGNTLPSNGVVQVTAMSEVLAWLETKFPRRISTASSMASQQRGELSNSSMEKLQFTTPLQAVTTV